MNTQRLELIGRLSTTYACSEEIEGFELSDFIDSDGLQEDLKEFFDNFGDIEDIREWKYLERSVGLCANCLYMFSYHSFIIAGIFELWEHYSGEVDYPVPHPELAVSHQDAYSLSDDLYEGAYGELRNDLYQFVKDNLKLLVK